MTTTEMKIKIDDELTNWKGIKIDSYKTYVESNLIKELTGLDTTINNDTININTQDSIEIPLNKVIVIDAGHGGFDSGAYDGKGKNDDIITYEKNLNLDVSKLVWDKLKKLKAKVILTRANDKYIKLNKRCKIANDNNADIFISIHFNASTSEKAKGIETFKFKGTKNKISHKLADNMQKELIQATGFKDRGVKEARYYVLKHTKMPACLLELGFITNNEEEKTINTKEFKNKVANAIVSAIVKTLS